MKPTSIRLNDELYEKIKEDAEKEKRSITKQIEHIIQQYYEMKKLIQYRTKTGYRK